MQRHPREGEGVEEAYQVKSVLKSKKAFFVEGLKYFNPLRPKARREPWVPIDFTVGRYQVKTAGCLAEREAAYRLRFEIFYGELAGQALPAEGGALDRDLYDELGDLLLIIDRERAKIVGTYRLISSVFSGRFYSASEFEIAPFLAEPGVKVELSRACIAKGHRGGLVIALLWKAIHEYLQRLGASYLFGCSSLVAADTREVMALLQYAGARESLEGRWNILPRPPYDRSPELLQALAAAKGAKAADERDLPPLLRAYLRAGARFTAVPAYDAQFSCYDFFTVLETAALKASHSKRFGKL